ncbi:MAG: hypothetical protein HY699_13020 [Deltaproteobacteria bacterium]|nr:hypothetical protein [Deltaproteobacteria bacterium]
MTGESDPYALYADAVARIATRYEEHGFCPWIFDDPRWLAAEAAAEQAFGTRKLGNVREAVAVFEATAMQVLGESCAIVSVGGADTP